MKQISVVILTKNSQKHIEKCIRSILLQKYLDFEIIIVDAASTDNTYNIIKYYIDIPNIQLRMICVPSDTSIGKARQIGIDNSKGEIIAFVDSDVELPHNNWLRNMSEPLSDETVAGTQTLAKYHENDPWILKRVHNSFEYKNKIIDKEHYEIIGTSHILIKKNLIYEVGGFRDIHSSEDLEVTKAIMDKGYNFIYLSEEKCYHYHIDNLWHFIKKRWRDKKLALRRIFLE